MTNLYLLLIVGIQLVLVCVGAGSQERKIDRGEFLEYLAQRDGRPAPIDARANDLFHWQTNMVAASAEAAVRAMRPQATGRRATGRANTLAAALPLIANPPFRPTKRP